ncbi:MAG: Maf family protein [Armatimonadota bacterium]
MENARAVGERLPAEVLGRPLVLASASPRRTELLRRVGIPHDVRVSGVPEEADRPGADPAEVAEEHASEKALNVAAECAGRLVLGADTVVVVDGEVLGKPEDGADARRMLRRLSGRDHAVITAVALALREESSAAAELLALEHVRTRVEFRALSVEEIAAYVASGEPMDKAGGYGIQGRGALLVSEIEGCYFNVVGLPLSRTWELLSALGHEVPEPDDAQVRGRRS